MNHIFSFLTNLFDQGYSYSSINTAKSALLNLVSIEGFNNWSESPDMARFMKGIYNLRTPTPKYSVSWDVNIVLKYLKNKRPLEELSLRELTLKTVTLIALTSGQRAQSIHLMKISNLNINENEIICFINDKTKTLRPGFKNVPIRIEKYSDDQDLCVFNSLKRYLQVTASLRQQNNQFLWISHVKPHNNVTKQTISRWIKSVLKEAGINTEIFSAHSTRMASVSKANALGIGLETILKTAGWKNANNYQKFYLRDLHQNHNAEFAKAVLELK